MRAFHVALCPFLYVAVWACAPAQLIKPTQDQMREALLKSSSLADIEGADAKPFHLTATFTTFDYRGQPAGEGTLEETWLKPGLQRRVVTFRGVTFTQASSHGSVRTTGDDFQGSFLERRIVDALLHAAPTTEALRSAASLDYKPLKIGGGVLDCVMVRPRAATDKSSAAEAAVSTYCMSPDTHLLRLVQERYDISLVYNKIVQLGNHEIAKEITVSQNGLNRGSLIVTSFSSAPDLKEADFDLPPNSRDLSVADIEVPGAVVAGRIVKKVPPKYPQEAKNQHISGTVTLSALIGEDGTIKELDVVSSPSPLLTESAIDAVKQWTYQPYLVNGTPTKVDTTITVNYNIG